MVRTSTAVCLLIVSALALSTASPAAAAPAPAAILNFKPIQDGVDISTPAADKIADCKVELIKGRGGKGSGWLLSDSEGKALRLFFDTNDDNKIDVWSYYKDGVEVYREIDSTFSGKPHQPDQYRWLNAGGSRWGLDLNRDGRIDSWKAISAQEASQELLAAMAAKDGERFKALLLSDAELKSLELPNATASRIRDSLAKAEARFADACTKMTALGSKPAWIHLETVALQCIPGDLNGGRYEVLRLPRGTILFDSNGKNDWVQTGEMLQVGQAWRLTDGPTPGAAMMDPDPMVKGNGTQLDSNPKLAKMVEELTALDKSFAAGTGAAEGNTPAATARHHLRRAELLERIVAEVKPEEAEQWVRQIADSFSTAAQNGEGRALARLVSLEQRVVAAMPGSNLAAYVTFREMQADYSRKLSVNPAPDFNKAQEAWLDRLGKFAAAYPKADDTADALLQCGMVSEFLNKEVDAKNWYNQLVKSFPDKPQAVKAAGAVRRLELEGKPLKIAGSLLNDTGTSFAIEQMAGKVVVVYYWASWNSQSVGDFAKLKLLLDSAAGKVELLCVNLDNTPDEGKAFLKRSPAPGVHLHQPGGLEGKLATDYGVMVLPNLFLVNKEGKVASKSVQISNLEDEVKKLLK